MKTIKQMGFAGITSVALVALAPSMSVADTQERSAGNLVHRVSHSLANTQEYTGKVSSGYKWGSTVQTASKPAWADAPGSSEPAKSGFKWSESNAAEQTRSRWGRNNTSEQVRSRWGRNNSADQARSRWGRNNDADQARSRWGRNNGTDQARSRWGRNNFSDQARSRWGRNSL